MLSVHDFAAFIKSTKGPCVVICDQDLRTLQQSLKVLGTDKIILAYPAIGQFPYDPASPEAARAITRVRTLQKLKIERDYCLLMSPLAWLEKRPLLDDTLGQPLIIKKNDTWMHTHLIDMFSLFAYVRSDVVEYPGQYAMRGDRIDVFSPHMSYPIRIDFFGNTVEEIKRFDPVSQRSLANGTPETIEIPPASEFILDEKHTTYYQQTYAKQLAPMDQQMVEGIINRTTTKNLGHLWPLFYEVSHHISHFWHDTPTIFCEPTIDLPKEREEVQKIYQRNQEQGRFVLAPEFLFL